MILVDSNIILDLFTNDPQWGAWSLKILEHYRDKDILTINPIIYTEVSIGFDKIENLDKALTVFKKLPLPFEACFLAGKTFIKYKRLSGLRKQPLPDFFIGAHAAVSKMKLITRDISRYKTYFPKLDLISPS